MRHCWKGIVVVAVLAVWTAGVLADHLVPEEGTVQVMLLRQKSVQDDLKLSEDQVRKIHHHAGGQWKKAQDVIKLDPKERKEKFAKMGEENEQFIKDTLSPAQHKRLHQITLQVAGAMWVTRPEIASELKLTGEQKKQARHLQHEARKEFEELLYSTKAEERREKHQAHCKACTAKIAKLLTDEQKAKWKELRGKPFKGEIQIDYPKAEK